MYETVQVTKNIKWEMGHRLSLHKGKCHNIHGHSYRASVLVEAKGFDENGMVTDFYNYKPLKEWVDVNFDHAFMINSNDPIKDRITSLAEEFNMKLVLVNFEPTAENIAKTILIQAYKYFDGRVGDSSKEHSYFVKQVQVWETADCSAIYTDDTIQLPHRF